MALLLVLALLSAGCGSNARPRQVLLITVDTLRHDHLSTYGYARDTSPNLDRWFADGAIYSRAYSTESSTSPSVVSLLTGQLPQDHGIRLLYQLAPDDLRLLTDLLPEGWETAAFVANTVLTDEAIGLAGRFDHYDDYVAEQELYRKVFERNARDLTDATLAWLDGRDDPARPLFLWVHYIDPHGPYQPPPEWERRFEHDLPRPIDPWRVPAYQRHAGVSDGEEYIDRYDEEIAFFDRELGRLLDGFAALLPIDETLIVLTADHGETLMEHEWWFTHGYQVYEELVRVPLLLRGPGVPALRSDAPVSGIDVAPTILAALGRTVPGSMAGVDLRAAHAIDAERLIFVEASQAKKPQWRGVVQGSRKWMLKIDWPGREPLERRSYDLTADPGEQQGRPWPADSAAARELERLVAEDPDPAGTPELLVAGHKLDGPKVAPGRTPEQLERLRALGYVD